MRTRPRRLWRFVRFGSSAEPTPAPPPRSLPSELVRHGVDAVHGARRHHVQALRVTPAPRSFQVAEDDWHGGRLPRRRRFGPPSDTESSLAARRASFVLLCAVLVAAACGDDGSADADIRLPDGGGEGIERLTIDVPFFHPEGIDRASDGSFYVSSFATGALARIAPGRDTASILLAPGTLAGGGVGVRVVGDSLWACAASFMGDPPSALREVDLRTGEVVRTFELPGGGFCNDLDAGPDGAIYVTDSFGGRVLRLAPGGATLETWASDERWLPGPAFPLSLNGIAVRDARAVYVGRMDDGTLIRIGISPGGDAGESVVVFEGGRAFGFDGMRWRDANRLVAVTGRTVSMLTDAGEDVWSIETVDDSLDEPATLTIVGDDAWVTEARFSVLFDGDASTVAEPPFHVVRVPLPR